MPVTGVEGQNPAAQQQAANFERPNQTRTQEDQQEVGGRQTVTGASAPEGTTSGNQARGDTPSPGGGEGRAGATNPGAGNQGQRVDVFA